MDFCRFKQLRVTNSYARMMRFTCCLNMGLYFKIYKISLQLFAWRYVWKAVWTKLIILPMLLFAKRYIWLWQNYDIWKFTADAILFGEIVCKNIYLNDFCSVLSANLVWIRKLCKNYNPPACFIALTFAWSLNLVLPQLPGDSANVNA